MPITESAIVVRLRYGQSRSRQPLPSRTCGAVAEWSKALAWKVSIRQKRIEGSNPSRSANQSAELNEYLADLMENRRIVAFDASSRGLRMALDENSSVDRTAPQLSHA